VNQLHSSASRPNVLVVSDDPEFSRSLVARWQTERTAPEITLATSDVWRPGSAADQDLTIVGALPNQLRSSMVAVLSDAVNSPSIWVTADEAEAFALRASHPQLVVIERRDEWISALILLANEMLRRVEALKRAHRAESAALELQRYATLGRYMLEARPNINDALTSVLGNADLLLLEPGQTLERAHEQIITIHKMSLRLNEIMQRFSSLASEMLAADPPPEPASRVPPAALHSPLLR
jgi:signal transduction histidine kinase